jgi:hypothetical protein
MIMDSCACPQCATQASSVTCSVRTACWSPGSVRGQIRQVPEVLWYRKQFAAGSIERRARRCLRREPGHHRLGRRRGIRAIAVGDVRTRAAPCIQHALKPESDSKAQQDLSRAESCVSLAHMPRPCVAALCKIDGQRSCCRLFTGAVDLTRQACGAAWHACACRLAANRRNSWWNACSSA